MIKRYTIRIILSIIIALSSSAIFAAAITQQIILDQLGYRTTDDKWFMIANPKVGQNSGTAYVPGATVQLLRASDNALMQTITLTSYLAGSITAQTGDIVWQGDFSTFTTPGTYYIMDPTNNRQSYNFDIRDDVYNGILAQTVKSYYYQRCGITITAACGGAWTHNDCHVAQGAAHLYDGSDQGAPRDITGGWHDAGDYRKYVTFTFTTLWDLMHAYDWYPSHFADNTGIPESNNGIPDILDEVKWELDWLLKMQKADGSVFSGAFVMTNGSNMGNGDPSLENTVYYYANFSTAATSTCAMAWALGSRLIAPFNAAYALTLRTAAENAWTFLESHTANIQYNHTFNNANANWNAADDAQGRVAAAAELWALTGTLKYKTYVDAHYNDPATTSGGWHQPIINGYFETGASGIIQRGLVSYALSAGATGSVITAINTSLNQGIQNQGYGQRNNDPYKAYMYDTHYFWGSNSEKGEWANLQLWGQKLNVNAGLSTAYNKVAEEYLHYFHGRNPLSWCFITQSQLVGADKPVTSFFHSWLGEGSAYSTNPAPGILTGGPNQNYTGDVGNSGGTPAYPPAGEPIQKSYRNWNVAWPDCSWTVTENGIYYQARYTFLVAAFAASAGPMPTSTNTQTNTPYAGTPTFTPTRTRTVTITPTNTLTPIPCNAVNYSGEAPANLASGGAWVGVSGTVSEVTTQSHSATHSLQVHYVWTGGWYQAFGWNWENWVAGKFYDANAATGIELWLMSGAGTITTLGVELVDTANAASPAVNVTTYLGGGVTTAWQKVTIPLADFTGINKASLMEIRIITGGTAAGDQTIYMDDFSFLLPCGTPTNTPLITSTFTPVITPTFTRTRTITPSMTFTPTFSRTASPTQVNTQTLTPSNTPTRTNTPVNTNTNTPVNTATLTRSNTPTNTGTYTPTIQPSATITPSATRTNTPSPTGTGTFTRTVSPTFTVTQTGTLGPSPSFTQSRTMTPSSTGTNTGTRTFTASPSATQTATPTFTATGSYTRTVSPTFTVTQTGTLGPSPSFTQSRTNTPSYTVTVTNTFTQTPTLTRTATPTFTWTIVLTQTFTATFTRSATVSSTPSFTVTNTGTYTSTPSLSVTQTATPTLTPTGTFTRTFTSTVTSTRTPTFTRTPTITLTDSPVCSPTETWTGTPPTPTITATITETGTELPADTDTPVDTDTATGTVTPTYTRTSTSSVSPTLTFTLTNTPVNTATRTATITNTSIVQTSTVTPVNTATLTAIATNTPQNTQTRTATATRTNTPAATATNTLMVPSSTVSPVNTATRTITVLDSPTLTITITYNPSSTPTAIPAGEIHIDDVTVYPCPVQKSTDPLNLLVQFTGKPVKASFKIYTDSFRLVREERWDTGLTYPSCVLAIQAYKIANLANGTYYCVLDAEDAAQKRSNRKTRLLLIIR